MPERCFWTLPIGRSIWWDAFADCFGDYRRQDLIEHGIGIRVGQRVLTIALGYEDLNDHDELRHDPLMAVLSGKLAARREYCDRWPASGYSIGWN